MKKIVELLFAIKQYIANYLKYIEQMHQQEQLAFHQQKLAESINIIAGQLHKEIFDLFKRTPLGFLRSVNIPEDIIFDSWCINQRQVIYSYQVYVNNMPNEVVLQQCKNHLTKTAYRFQQQLIATMGYQEAQMAYPCIVAGLYFLNIRQIGCMIQFDIITHIAP